MPVALKCSVRGCGQELALLDARYACAAGHSFDLHRTGSLNLLQPQDRRSREPGDSREATLARRRLADHGYARSIHEAFRHAIQARVRTPGPATLLDVGCGEGAFLRSLDPIPGLERHGVDISAPAIELAAKAKGDIRFVVANADRFLPYTDHAFGFVTSIDARTNAREFARVLKSGGLVLVAVPAADDLVELREHLYGSRVERPRFERVEQDLAAHFQLVERTVVRERRLVETAELRDLLIATYRGFRESERAALATLSSLHLTMSHDVLAFEPR